MNATNPKGQPPAGPLTEPVVVAEFWANRRGESVRVQLREYEGRALVDIRRYFTNADGKLQPTPKGLSLTVLRLPELAKALAKAERQAVDLGLIGAGRDHG